jgi:MarR family transcriptional regulator, negative regulator of the multidrug operon emrRAB
MAASVNPRLDNLLVALSLGLVDEGDAAMERATGLTGAAPAALLALDEFLDGTTVGRLAEVLDLTHSGAVRLVSQLEALGLATRRPGADRRQVEVRLTTGGQRTSRAARAARDLVVQQTTAGLSGAEAATLERLLARLVGARVAVRIERRRAGDRGPWLCRTCDMTACGRPDGRCPAQAAAALSP